MKFISTTSSLLSSLILFAPLSLTIASPQAHPPRPTPTGVYSPTLTSPTQGAVWYKGENRVAIVTWDKTSIPANLADLSNGTQVKLGYMQLEEDGNDWYPKWTQVVATNFKFGDGEVSFPLPGSVATCSQCIVGLYYAKPGQGSSISDPFEIRDASE